MSKIQETSTQEVVPYFCKPRSPRGTFTPIGDRYMIKAKLSIGEHGEQIAEPGDKIDFQAYIQASKASTDIATIVARYNAGDESVLNVTPNGFYGDVDLIPSSVNDVAKISKLSETARENYERLPEEVKALFGSSENFFNAVLNNKTDEILAKLDISKKEIESTSKVEKKEGEE